MPSHHSGASLVVATRRHRALAGCAPTATAGGGAGTHGCRGIRLPAHDRQLRHRGDFEAAPERVVTIKSTSTEMLLALGLGDRIVGTAFQDGPVPDECADAAADLAVDLRQGAQRRR